MTNIIFRLDANSNLGFGHLERCRVLAEEFVNNKCNCILYGPAKKYRKNKDNKLFSEWHEVENWISEEKDAIQLINFANSKNYVLLIIDDYRANTEYQKLLFESGLKWLQFDGRANKPLWATWILNQNPSAKNSDYTDLLKGDNQKLLLGPTFALVRKEFQQTRHMQDMFNEHVSLLVCFGAGDDRGAIIKVLNALFGSEIQFNIKIISGENNPNNSEIRQWINSSGIENCEMYIGPESVSSIMNKCDIAIVSGGTISIEAIACKLPLVLISIADNQVKQCLAWASKDVAIYLGDTAGVGAEEIKQSIVRIIENQQQYINNIRKLNIDGMGAMRVVNNIL